MKLQTYLNFNGNTREAFEFYAKLFNGKIVAMMKYADMPAEGGCPPEIGNLILHARVDFGDQRLMATDATPHHPYKGMTGAYVVTEVAEPAEADRIFKALAEKGEIEMPIQETFWAHRYGITKDRFGVQWMVNCVKPEFA